MSATARVRTVLIAIVLCGAIAGCGKALPGQAPEQGSGPVAAIGPLGAGGLATSNTTRLGGSDAPVDAAAVALAVYPGQTLATRPRAVVLVDSGNWPAALAASTLAGASLHAPLLYSEGSSLPPASELALSTMRPTGARVLANAQAIEIGDAPAPAGYRTRSLTGEGPAALAVAIERLSSSVRRAPPSKLIVTAADAPPAMTMPAAGLSAQSGAPILFVEKDAIPSATLAELTRLGHSSIYVVGPSSIVSEAVVSELGRFGPVTRIAGNDPTGNAIAVARFTDGTFGWGVEEPGHGLVFAGASRPLDAPAAAPLSASGDYGPLLLLESADSIPGSLASYLSDLQPGTPPGGPVRGVYNHAWLIGDERTISAATQARIDSLLEVSSKLAAEPALSTQTTPGTTTGAHP